MEIGVKADPWHQTVKKLGLVQHVGTIKPES